MTKGYESSVTAIEITKLVLQSMEIKRIPTVDDANSIADFIKTLADRLEPIVERLQE